jgi:uncharacterized protein involved in response to NO
VHGPNSKLATPQTTPRRSALLDGAFRPFFLAGSLWAAVALGLWIGLYRGDIGLASPLDPLMWHIHEMLFGFVFAAIAGFLLTAIPNWTGRPPVRGGKLAALVVLWIAGRFVSTVLLPIPFALVVAIDVAFAVALGSVAAREVILARNWRNLRVLMPVALLGGANLLLWLEAGGVAVPAGIGWRLALAAIITLVSVIASRIVPAFTRNWLMRERPTIQLSLNRWTDRVAMATLHLGLIGWAIFPASRVAGALLLIAAVANLVRLAGWRGARTAAEPLLLILHFGYLWIVLGAGLLGASMLWSAVPLAAAIHALTAGAIGTMILGVMTRVSLGHSGRVLHADGVTTLLYGAVLAAGIVRVAAAFATALAMPLLSLSAALWVAAFLIFALRYWPILTRPRL